MKKAIYLTLVALFVSMGTMFGQTKSENIKVAGNCGMCKMRIEKAAKSVSGVTAASWDKKTKVLELSYDAAKVKPLTVEKAIAKVGHDTQSVKANDSTYKALAKCCLYDRMVYDKK